MQIEYKAETLQIEIKDNYAIVQLSNGKVNVINTPLVKDLKATFEALDKDKNIKGVILSGRPHAFSAGLDIVSLAGYSPEEMIEFWENYMYTMQAMVKFSKPLVCAITGFAPAGGTILALCSDYRIMGKGEKHVIGMPEFELNLQIPQMLCDVYAYYLGEVKAWQSIQKAKLFNSDEALIVGLVDESVEVEEVLPRAERHLKKQIQVYHKVFNETKRFVRRGLHQVVLEQDVPKMAREFLAFNSDPFFKKMMQMFVARLKKK